MILMFYILWLGYVSSSENASKLNNFTKKLDNKNIKTMKEQLKMLGLSIDGILKFPLVIKNITNINENFYRFL